MKKTKQLIIFIFLSLILLSSNSIAEEYATGEIINVNFKYKIAFTDLSNIHLENGDIVEISKDGNFITYLEVLESSGAISKLVPSKKNRNYLTENNFKKVKIGYEVTKIVSYTDKLENTNEVEAISNEQSIDEMVAEDLEEALAEPYRKDNEGLNEQFRKLSENYVVISNQLAELVSEKSRIEIKLANTQKELDKLSKDNALLRNRNSQISKDNQSLLRNKNSFNKKKCEDQINKYKKAIKVLENKFITIEKLMEEGN